MQRAELRPTWGRLPDSRASLCLLLLISTIVSLPGLGGGQTPFPDYYLLDFQRRKIRKMTIPLWACGWWDNEQILIGATNHDLLLYDVRKEATSRLVSFATIAAFLKEHDIHEDPAQSRPFPVWNGREFDFYLTDTHQKWAAEESFLAKLERPDGTLALVSPRFKFQWSDHFDAAGRHYVYSGRETGDASDGVVLRDLESGSNRVLVAGTTNKYHSMPAFYHDSVIYVHSNALWQIGLDGSHNVRLFPP